MKAILCFILCQLFLNTRTALECGYIVSITQLEKTEFLLPSVSISNSFLVQGGHLSPLFHTVWLFCLARTSISIVHLTQVLWVRMCSVLMCLKNSFHRLVYLLWILKLFHLPLHRVHLPWGKRYDETSG